MEPLTTSLHQRLRRSETVADDLRQQILSGRLPVGRKLPTETELCKHYGVSRTTLREAVQLLRSTGLLEVAPGRGSFVRSPNMDLLLPSLQLALQQRGTHLQEVLALQGWLTNQILALLCQHPQRLRGALPTLTPLLIDPAANPSLCAKTELQWLCMLGVAAQLPLSSVLLELTGSLLLPHRTAAYSQPNRALEVNQLQQRCLQAILNNEAALASRLLGQCLRPAGNYETQAA